MTRYWNVALIVQVEADTADEASEIAGRIGLTLKEYLGQNDEPQEVWAWNLEEEAS